MAICLAIDFGTVRSGVACGDTEIRLAQPLGIVEGRGSERTEQLVELVRKQGAERIVFGLPLTLEGNEGAAARRARQLASELQRRVPECEFVFWDERFSTERATQKLREGGGRTGVDAAAAAVLLQDYFDATTGE